MITNEIENHFSITLVLNSARRDGPASDPVDPAVLVYRACRSCLDFFGRRTCIFVWLSPMSIGHVVGVARVWLRFQGLDISQQKKSRLRMEI